jgi:hypothetical protein
MATVARRRLLLAGIAGGVLAVLGPHLYTVAGGAIVLAVAASAATWRREPWARVPLLALLAAPALLFVGYYTAVIAGPTGLSIAALTGGPFSAAAESMLLPPLAIAAAGYFAPWPLHRMLPGPALAIVGVALLVRLGHGALPGALEAWRTVFVPLGVLALWGAAVTGRVRHAAAAAAFTACFAAAAGGARAAWMIAAALLLGAVVDASGSRHAGRRDALGAAAAALAVLGAAFALASLLRTEVVYGVVAWVGAVVLALRMKAAPAG